jgi:hypothetical protein
VSTDVWNPEEIDWWVEVFDDRTEDLVEEPALQITESEIRQHFAVAPTIETIDGLKVTDVDLPWLARFMRNRPTNLSTRSAFICARAKPSE